MITLCWFELCLRFDQFIMIFLIISQCQFNSLNIFYYVHSTPPSDVAPFEDYHYVTRVAHSWLPYRIMGPISLLNSDVE